MRRAASPAQSCLCSPERDDPLGLVRGDIAPDVDIDIEFIVVIVVIEQGDPGEAGVVLLAEPNRQVGIVIGRREAADRSAGDDGVGTFTLEDRDHVRPGQKRGQVGADVGILGAFDDRGVFGTDKLAAAGLEGPDAGPGAIVATIVPVVGIVIAARSVIGIIVATEPIIGMSSPAPSSALSSPVPEPGTGVDAVPASDPPPWSSSLSSNMTTRSLSSATASPGASQDPRWMLAGRTVSEDVSCAAVDATLRASAPARLAATRRDGRFHTFSRRDSNSPAPCSRGAPCFAAPLPIAADRLDGHLPGGGPCHLPTE